MAGAPSEDSALTRPTKWQVRPMKTQINQMCVSFPCPGQAKTLRKHAYSNTVNSRYLDLAYLE